MKYVVLTFVCFLGCCFSGAQSNGFTLVEGVDKFQIPFQIHGNQIIVPVKVNGVQLNFALDSGSSKSIIFDFNGIDSLNIQMGRKLKYAGFGEKEYFEAYYSENNYLSIFNNYINSNSEILVMIDDNFSISDRIGYPVNGIIGMDFFKENLVHIDNENFKITIYRHGSKLPRKIKRLEPFDIRLIDGKPYVKVILNNEDTKLELSTMLDTGSSDALLLFNLGESSFKVPTKGFRDYLGYGMNGKIFGMRTKLDALNLWGQVLAKVTLSIPFNNYVSNEKQLGKNYGSIGMEIMRRFNLTFDYKNNLIYAYPLNGLKDGFFYNMTGIAVKKDGYEIDARLEQTTEEKAQGFYKSHDGQVSLNLYAKLKYKKIPNLIVESVAQGSIAFNNDIYEGDQIIKANGFLKHQLSIQKLSDLFHSNPYSTLKLTILRDGIKLKKELKLVPLID